MHTNAASSPRVLDNNIMVIGFAASAGGLKALLQVLTALPADLKAGIMVVQHISPTHPSYLPQILARRVRLKIRQARAGNTVQAGVVYIAPPDYHVVVQPGGRIMLSRAERVHFLRPAADILFESLSLCYGPRALAVVLSGTGVDGAAGATAIKARGGAVIVQDPATSEYYEMPAAAIETGSVDAILALDQIAPWIIRFVDQRVAL